MLNRLIDFLEEFYDEEEEKDVEEENRICAGKDEWVIDRNKRTMAAADSTPAGFR